MDNDDEVLRKEFKCPHCGKEFPTVWQAYGHMNDKHPVLQGS